MNSKFIGSQQTHRKKSLHQIDLQETIVLRIKRERERKPSSYCLRTHKVYGGLLTHHRRGTNEDDEPLRDGVRLDLEALELAAAGCVFRRLL